MRTPLALAFLTLAAALSLLVSTCGSAPSIGNGYKPCGAGPCTASGAPPASPVIPFHISTMAYTGTGIGTDATLESNYVNFLSYTWDSSPNNVGPGPANCTGSIARGNCKSTQYGLIQSKLTTQAFTPYTGFTTWKNCLVNQEEVYYHYEGTISSGTRVTFSGSPMLNIGDALGAQAMQDYFRGVTSDTIGGCALSYSYGGSGSMDNYNVYWLDVMWTSYDCLYGSQPYGTQEADPTYPPTAAYPRPTAVGLDSARSTTIGSWKHVNGTADNFIVNMAACANGYAYAKTNFVTSTSNILGAATEAPGQNNGSAACAGNMPATPNPTSYDQRQAGLIAAQVNTASILNAANKLYNPFIECAGDQTDVGLRTWALGLFWLTQSTNWSLNVFEEHLVNCTIASSCPKNLDVYPESFIIPLPTATLQPYSLGSALNGTAGTGCTGTGALTGLDSGGLPSLALGSTPCVATGFTTGPFAPISGREFPDCQWTNNTFTSPSLVDIGACAVVFNPGTSSITLTISGAPDSTWPSRLHNYSKLLSITNTDDVNGGKYDGTQSTAGAVSITATSITIGVSGGTTTCTTSISAGVLTLCADSMAELFP